MSLLRSVLIVAWLGLGAAIPSWGHDAAADKPKWVTQAVSFRSADGVHLSGSWVTARNERAVAAVVLGQGAFPGERYENLAALMALRGIATLTYDKRGTGKSGGTANPRDVSAANLALFAADAAAAMRWVSKNPDARGLPRGFIAISQSGWVFPLAIAQSPKVDFLGFWSGPTCTTSEQIHFQNFSQTRGFARSKMTDAEISEAMSKVSYRPDDVDPLESLKAVSVPALWLFGGQDPWVPVELSVRRLQALINTGRSNFHYQVFPEEGHDLADSSQQPSFVAMIDWIKQRK